MHSMNRKIKKKTILCDSLNDSRSIALWRRDDGGSRFTRNVVINPQFVHGVRMQNAKL